MTYTDSIEGITYPFEHCEDHQDIDDMTQEAIDLWRSHIDLWASQSSFG